MASLFKVSVVAANAACDAIVDLVDGGAGAGKLKIWTGAQPATPLTADSGTQLAEIALQDPAFGGAAATVATLLGVTLSDASADATGTAGHFRVYDSNDVCIFQGNCGDAGDAPVDMQFDNKSIVITGTVSLTAMTVTVPVT